MKNLIFLLLWYVVYYICHLVQKKTYDEAVRLTKKYNSLINEKDNLDDINENLNKKENKLINIDNIDFIETVDYIKNSEYTRILFQEHFIYSNLTLDEVYKLIEDASKN